MTTATNPKFPKPVKREAKARKGLRRTWMKKKPPRRLKRGEGDPAYMAFVRTLPCLMQPRAQALCRWPIHAHHAIHRSQGGKDNTCVPLCMVHHMQLHSLNGVFSGWTRLEKFAWSQRAIEETRRAYDAR